MKELMLDFCVFISVGVIFIFVCIGIGALIKLIL